MGADGAAAVPVGVAAPSGYEYADGGWHNHELAGAVPPGANVAPHAAMFTPQRAASHVRFDAEGTAGAGNPNNSQGKAKGKGKSKGKGKGTPHPARGAAPTPALAPDRLYKIKSKLRAASYTVHGPDIKALFDLLDRCVAALRPLRLRRHRPPYLLR